ncbi:MAG TPA: TlpA disulfide reductase family protein [Terriglobales bacterium]|jgi:thiol-disulfide isomerase/thioredoxin
MRVRAFLLALLLSALCRADIISSVREAASQSNFTKADAALLDFRTRNGITPEYIEAVSWAARGALAAKQFDQADSYAAMTIKLVREQLHNRDLDAEEHLPTALGAAIEVQAQTQAARGDSEKAIALLKRNLVFYGKTSIGPRLQKNLNMLALVGQPAPSLQGVQFLGTKPPTLAQLKGSPVLMFFWAHWCGDCKQEGPVIASLSSEFSSKGLRVIAPTQLYGYGAGGEDATPKKELAYIGQVWNHYYPALKDVPVPVSKQNFNSYGASTTPTLVLLDRNGRVSLYHPGVMPYSDLRGAIEKVLAN